MASRSSAIAPRRRGLVPGSRVWAAWGSPGPARCDRRVVGDEPALDGGVERGAQHRVDTPDRARRERVSPLAGGDGGIHTIQVVGAQVQQPDVAEVRDQVVVRQVGVEHDGLGFERVLAGEPAGQVVGDGEVGDVHVGQQSAHGLLQARCAAALVGKPALLVCIRLPVLSRPYSRTYCQEPAHRCGANEPSGLRGQARVWRCETVPCFNVPPGSARESVRWGFG